VHNKCIDILNLPKCDTIKSASVPLFIIQLATTFTPDATTFAEQDEQSKVDN
jgi:hypothetical protein